MRADDEDRLAGQFAAVDENLTGFENLDMIGRLYHLGRNIARVRARELLERFDMTPFADRPASTYSGGQRRRLDIVAALGAEYRLPAPAMVGDVLVAGHARGAIGKNSVVVHVVTRAAV